MKLVPNELRCSKLSTQKSDCQSRSNIQLIFDYMQPSDKFTYVSMKVLRTWRVQFEDQGYWSHYHSSGLMKKSASSLRPWQEIWLRRPPLKKKAQTDLTPTIPRPSRSGSRALCLRCRPHDACLKRSPPAKAAHHHHASSFQARLPSSISCVAGNLVRVVIKRLSSQPLYFPSDRW